MNLAKIDTAKSFLLGPILDADGVAVTTLDATALKVIKNGSVGDPNGSTTMTHSFTGHYVVAAAAGDFSALGQVTFAINSTTNAAAPVSFQVVTANVYDSFSGTDKLDVAVVEQSNIDFGALQKASLNAATPASVQNIPVDGSLSVTVSDKTGFSLSATGADLILKSSTFVQAIVAAINELATYGLTALNTLLTSTGVKLADDAITAGKFDESTAFPLKSADTGSTAVARTGADGDTLETLSDQLDTIGDGSLPHEWTYTVTDDSGDPVADLTVTLTSDSAGTQFLRSGTTNGSGVATFYFKTSDIGTTVYVWRQKAGVNANDPDVEVID